MCNQNHQIWLLCANIIVKFDFYAVICCHNCQVRPMCVHTGTCNCHAWLLYLCNCKVWLLSRSDTLPVCENTRGPRALTVMTLHWPFVRGAYICISAAPLLQRTLKNYVLWKKFSKCVKFGTKSTHFEKKYFFFKVR